MEAKRDFYEILGIEKNADENTIKKAYRKLAKKYHPDQNGGNAQAEKRFKEVTEAYTILSDPKKRKLYDQFGHAAFDGSASGSEGYGAYGESSSGFHSGGPGNGNFSGFWQDGNGGGGTYREYHFENGSMDDIFGDIFGEMFGGGRSSSGQRSGFAGGNGNYGSGFSENGGSSSYGGEFSGNSGNFSNGFSGGSGSYGSSGFTGGSSSYGSGFSGRGADLQADVSVTFDEAAFGCDKIIHLRGEDGRTQSLQVHIPAGIETGKSVRLKGKGAPGVRGGSSGDLLLKVTVGEKAGFERKGMDVYTVVNIPFSTAVLGGEVMVQTLYGTVACRIKEGTQSGTKIRLRGKGIVSMKDPKVRGDQYVVIQIQVPQNLTREAKEKLKEFEAACGRKRWSAA